MASAVRIVLSHCADLASAERLAENAVAAGLAACVNIQPQVRSIYRWQGKIESSSEVGLVFKTTADRSDALLSALRDWHPYELPELLVVEPSSGWPPYLDWVVAETRQNPA